MKLNIKKSSTGSKSDVKEHHKNDTGKGSKTDTQDSAMEKFVKEKGFLRIISQKFQRKSLTSAFHKTARRRTAHAVARSAGR